MDRNSRACWPIWQYFYRFSDSDLVCDATKTYLYAARLGVWARMDSDVFMGIAIYRIRQTGTAKPGVRQATALFILQLLFNAVWSFIFFGNHNIYGGLIDIGILWVLIFLLMVKFYEIDKLAGHLIVPYFLWVFFALALNYGVWILNP